MGAAVVGGAVVGAAVVGGAVVLGAAVVGGAVVGDDVGSAEVAGALSSDAIAFVSGSASEPAPIANPMTRTTNASPVPPAIHGHTGRPEGLPEGWDPGRFQGDSLPVALVAFGCW